jgi:hypothetical protein
MRQKNKSLAMKRIIFSFITILSVTSLASAQWNQQGADLVSNLEDASSGWAVDLNEDGTVAAVGSRDGSSNGVNSVGDAQACEMDGRGMGAPW